MGELYFHKIDYLNNNRFDDFVWMKKWVCVRPNECDWCIWESIYVVFKCLSTYYTMGPIPISITCEFLSRVRARASENINMWNKITYSTHLICYTYSHARTRNKQMKNAFENRLASWPYYRPGVRSQCDAFWMGANNWIFWRYSSEWRWRDGGKELPGK